MRRISEVVSDYFRNAGPVVQRQAGILHFARDSLCFNTEAAFDKVR